jgi:hypothetical protein
MCASFYSPFFVETTVSSPCPWGSLYNTVGFPQTEYPIDFKYLKTVGWVKPTISFPLKDFNSKRVVDNDALYILRQAGFLKILKYSFVLPTYVSCQKRIRYMDVPQIKPPLDSEVFSLVLNMLTTYVDKTGLTDFKDLIFNYKTVAGYPFSGATKEFMLLTPFRQWFIQNLWKRPVSYSAVSFKSELLLDEKIQASSIRAFFPS